MTVHEKINARAMIKDFATYGERDLKALINKLRIRETGAFVDTVRVIGSAGGDSLTIELFYNYYGIFVQYGLGKGVGMGDQGVARMVGGGRKQKKWMKGVGHMRNRLAEIYQERSADALQQNVADSLLKRITLKF